MFNRERLTFARKRRGLNMSALARVVGLESRTISSYENGEYVPPADRIVMLASALTFPTTFFFQEGLPTISPDAASFRSLTKMSAAKRDVALSSGGLALLLNDAIEERFKLPAPDFADLSREGDAESAASSLRRYWGIGELPVKNMIHLLESKGARVFSLAIDAQEVDAFSFWRDEQPFVFLNTRKSSERSRFDCAHELAHLVMHRHGEQKVDGSQMIEREANNFAGAFLMPRASVLTYAPKNLTTLEHLIQLKQVWGVSVAALNFRLHQLGILSEWHYRELNIQISKRGYRTSEPQSVPRETSQVLGKVLTGLRSEGVGIRKIAEDLHVSPKDIEDLIFCLTISSVGENQNKKSYSRHRADLKIVK